MLVPKTFLHALSIVGTNPQKAKAFLNDKRLTFAEKSILRCHSYLRANDLRSLFSELESLSGDLDPIVDAQKHLLWGLALNNQSHFHQAEKRLRHALKLLAGHGLEFFELIGTVNLFVVYQNLNDTKQMGLTLDRLTKFEPERDIDVARIKRCVLNYHLTTENFPEALEVLADLEALKGKLPDMDQLALLITKFELNVMLGDLENCREVVKEMKGHRAFNLSENFNYMRMLLEHYLDHTPLYFEDKDFAEHPNLYHQIKVIQHLEEGHREKALVNWAALRKEHPELYGDPFDFRGGKTIFNLCLSKYSSSASSPVEEEASASKVVDALFEIFTKSSSPIRKELLYEKIWGHPPESKSDLMRLTRSIYRLKQKHGLNIKTRKGSYFLEDIFKKNSKVS